MRFPGSCLHFLQGVLSAMALITTVIPPEQRHLRFPRSEGPLHCSSHAAARCHFPVPTSRFWSIPGISESGTSRVRQVAQRIEFNTYAQSGPRLVVGTTDN